MKITRILANQHIFDGRPNGRPNRLLLEFEDAPPIRLGGAGDGATMTVDAQPLDAPVELGELGQIATHDMTDLLTASLPDREIYALRALRLDDAKIGIQLDLGGGDAFNFWIDGDELFWGNADTLIRHDWLEGRLPVVD